MLYVDPETSLLRFDISSSDVQDHRRPVFHPGMESSRLPVGHFLLRSTGPIIDAKLSLSLSLYDATCSGSLQTSKGVVHLFTYVHATENVFVVETRRSDGEVLTWDFVTEEAISLRQSYGLRTGAATRIDPGYMPNPKGVLSQDCDECIWVQPLTSGGGTVTAWNQSKGSLIASIAHGRAELPTTKALETVRRASATNKLASRTQHETWWHEYYPASFVSIPDSRLESFYWIQIYKLACATRRDGALVDNNGPWLQDTAWPYATWNLNVQLTYWPAISSNHADLVDSLMNAIHVNSAELIQNCEESYQHDSATLLRATGSDLHSPANAPVGKVPDSQSTLPKWASSVVPPEIGNLPWALHNCWLAFKHTMDLDMLRVKLFPILRRATNYYLHFLYSDANGCLHLPSTYSPEYGSSPDLNYDLALLRWSCNALIEAVDRLDLHDELVPKWKHVLENLVEYPADDRMGWLIGKDLALTSSHRHYSHMLQAYPLYLVNRGQGLQSVEVIEKTLAHWQSMPEKLQGYSFSGASSISSALGKGNDALRYLKELFDVFLTPNTMYQEDGPVIETPLSGAQSILDMLLQGWGGAVRPFPAMPKEWRQAVFADLSAEGGFLVSGQWTEHGTKWVTIFSRAGQPLLVETDIVEPELLIEGKPVAAGKASGGFLDVDLRKGETALIRRRGDNCQPLVTPIPVTNDSRPAWGMRSP